ncbi:MAG: helix-turn-helix domain-containing protein [Phycisphaerales bacterium]|nr:MAG: helix-turn-helix domain-containing protein [Phycisphaerales bacterium]
MSGNERSTTTTTEPLLLSAQQAAELLGISRRHFLTLAEAGQIGPEYVQLGNRKLWIRDELQRWVISARCPCRREWLQAQGEGGGPPRDQQKT